MSYPLFLSLALAFAGGLGPSKVSVPSKEIYFKSKDGFELSGILEYPAGATGKVPCIILHPGSGPTDRDGNQPQGGVKTDLLIGLAAEIRRHGVATFRFDKRAVGVYRASWPKDPCKYNQFFSWENHLNDFAAACAVVRADSGINRERIGLLGHSEGGTLSLAIWSRVKPSCMILLGTAGRRLDQVLIEQVSKSLERQPLSPEVRAKYVAETRENCRLLLETGHVAKEVSPGLQSLFRPSVEDFLGHLLSFEPRPAAEKFVGPVLVMNGEKDIQVSATRDFGPLTSAFRSDGASKPVFFVVAGASHNLKAVSNPLESGFAGPIVPAALATLGSFVDRWAKVVR